MNGYSRYAATALWVGNADNSLVHDGPAYGYASANTTIGLFKSWMARYQKSQQTLQRCLRCWTTSAPRQPLPRQAHVSSAS